MKVYTNINTLIKVQDLFIDLKINEMLIGGDLKIQAKDLLDQLLNKGKLIEFIQIITRDNTTDFAEMELKELLGIAKAFFTAIAESLPDVIAQAIRIKAE